VTALARGIEGKYGFTGWKEFASNRRVILNEFDRAKGLNESRPVQTEHGIAGEAGLRNWLCSFLPRRYGVTSGFIIPDSHFVLAYEASNNRSVPENIIKAPNRHAIPKLDFTHFVNDLNWGSHYVIAYDKRRR
jgi:hypothetical protein